MSLEGVGLRLIENVDDAFEFTRWLGERRPILAVDTETEGLIFYRDKLRMIQFGDAHTGWAMEWDGWKTLVRDVVRKLDEPLVLHNAKFDAHMIEHWTGVSLPWRHVHDTRIMAHLIDSTKGTGLKGLASRLIDSRAGRMEEMKDEAMARHKWDWKTVPVDFEPYWAYGALDAVLTARLYELLEPQVRRSYAGVYDLELAVTEVVMRMETRGSRIDVPYTGDIALKTEVYVAEATKWCRDAYGVNPGSNQQVIKRLKEDGVEFTKLTKGGALALDEEVLLGIDHPLAAAVLHRRKKEKVLGTYFHNFLELCDDADLLHPSINVLGARTGRMSVDTPALQTLPRGAVVRDCFIPRVGNRLILADFDQIEMRLLAHFANDENMIDSINSGDLHTETARKIYRDSTLTKKDPRRQVAKNAGFAKVYGAGVAKFSKTAGVSEDVGRAFLEAYDLQYPGVRRFQDYVQFVGQERAFTDGEAYVRSPVGRRHVADDDRLYTLVNYLIQGTAADVYKQALVNLSLAGLDDYLLLPVHDEVLLDAPQEDSEEISRVVGETMLDRSWAVPLTVGVEVVERWGDKYRVREFRPAGDRAVERGSTATSRGRQG